MNYTSHLPIDQRRLTKASGHPSCTPLPLLSLFFSMLSMEHAFAEEIKLREEYEGHIQTKNTLQSIFNSASSAIYIKDLEGKYLFINRKFEEHFHISSKNTISKTDYDLFSIEVADKFRKNDLEVQTKGEQIEFYEEAPQNDSIHFYTSIKFPLHTQDKKIYAVCGISTDITEQKKIEEAAHKAYIRNRTLLEESPFCNKIIDLDFRLQYMSPVGQKMLKIDDITPYYGTKYPPDFYPELAKTRLNEHLEQAKNGVSSTLECKIVDMEGTDAWFQTSFMPARDDDGRVECIIGISIDITDRKQAEKALRSADIKNFTLLEGSPICNKIIDLDSRLQYMSAAGQEMLKIDDITPFYGTKFPPDFYPELTKTLLTNHLEQAKKGEASALEFQAVNAEGTEAWFQSCFVPVRGDEGRVEYIIGTSIDITDRKQAEKALRSADIRNRTLLEESPICNKIIDLDFRLQYMSAAGKNMLKIDDITPFYGTKFPPDFYPELTKTCLNEQLERAKQGETSSSECPAVDIEGNEVWFQTTCVPARDDKGRVEYIIATSVDITDRKKSDELLSYQANHDALTGLVNRREFESRTERLLSTIKQCQSEHALCFMDLDQFKIINDTCGHIVGDEVIRQISVSLQKTVRQCDTLARLGGDEFGVLIEHCSLDEAHRVAMSLQKVVQNFVFPWEGRNFKVGVSMGLVPIIKTKSTFTELLKQADIACYVAKDKGRNRIHVYDTDDSEIVQRHGEMQWVNQINRALEEDQFYLYAQSIEPLCGINKKHYELLIRMRGEQGEMIPPGAFLPAAERYNLISKIDRWVIDKTFELMENYPSLFKDVGFCSINLSGQSLTELGFQDFVLNKFKSTKISPKKICFEITETAAISNLNTATLFISKMKLLGCYFALDDFGSGLSSFGYLKNMKVDYLKIDGMFVRDIVEDPIDRAMVKSINEIGQVMGMKTIAEFVENDEIKGMLSEIGVNFVQGYAIDKPMLIA